MGKPSNAAKQRWNSKKYTQVKVYVKPEIAAAFKNVCAASGVSMAGVLSRYMAVYAAVTVANHDFDIKKEDFDSVSTMKIRRKTVRAIMRLLAQVRDAEERFISNAPENLQSAPVYESAGHYVSVLDDVIEQLGEIY